MRFFLPSLPHGRGAGTAFDARSEQARLSEAVVRSAAELVGGGDDARALIERHCHTLTTLAPHVVLAWTWFGPPEADTIRPQVVAGAASPYAQALVIQRTPLTAIGPAFRTLGGARLEPFTVSSMSLYGPWRLAAREHGVRSVLALPLASTVDEQRGLFVLYADVPRYFEQVGVGLFEALAQLFSAVLSRATRNRALADAAHRDALTGLPNRGALSLLAPTLLRAVGTDAPLAVLMIDIDHFKRINDEHGHAGGDHALAAAANRLQSLLRQGDLLLRWGGEEFCLCLRDTAEAAAMAVAEKLRAGLAATPIPLADGTVISLTVSVGLAMLDTGEPLVTAIGRADRALYRAKRQGRNRVEAEPAPADDDDGGRPEASRPAPAG